MLCSISCQGCRVVSLMDSKHQQHSTGCATIHSVNIGYVDVLHAMYGALQQTLLR